MGADSLAVVGSAGIAAIAIAVAMAFFVWGWTRSARFRSEHGRPPWGISPFGWGSLHVLLLPIAWILYFAASRTTVLTDPALAYGRDTVIADSAEERERISKIVGQLPLLRPPQPDSRGWHHDPLGEREFRFFDGQRWTREVSDDPAQRVAAAVGDQRADLIRRLRELPPPQDTAASWHVDPLGGHQFRYFDGQEWTAEVREARSSHTS